MRLNQYFITNNTTIKVDGFNKVNCKDFFIYSHKNLSVTLAENKNCNLAILGFIINPFQPNLSNLDITKHITNLGSKNEILSYLEKCSGRFVLLINLNKDTFVVNDFMAQRQVYYYFKDHFTYLSSNEKLLLDTLNLTPEISNKKQNLSNDPVFLNIQEHWFLDLTSWDNRLHQLLPNHILNCKTKITERIPFYNKESLTYNNVVNQSSFIIKKSILAISKRYKLQVPITSGYDSRLMLAACLSENLKMKNFIFNRKGTYVKRDVKTAKILAKKYDLNFNIIDPKQLSEDFISKFKSQFIIPRILQKTQNIQWFKNNKQEEKHINIVGVGGGLLKAFYNQNKFNSAEEIIKEVSVNKNKNNLEAILKWLKTIKNNRLNKSDLFFLEIRTGLWANKTALELDFAELEEFSPFNNKYFVYSILDNTSIKQRKTLQFYNDLLEQTHLEITSIPLNPKTWRDIIKKIIFYDNYKKWIHKIKY